MGSSNLWLPQFGVDAMNAYFAASGGGMLAADVPPFHPSMPPPDQGGYDLGLCSGSATAAAANSGPQFTTNNLMLATLASQLYASAPHAQRPPHADHLGARTPLEESMDGGYDLPDAAILACHPQSDVRAMAPCSISSSDSMASSTDQFSPGPSRSAVTHMSRAVQSSEQSQQAYRPQPQPCFWPVHFAVVVARSPYAPVAQRVLNDTVGHVLRGVVDVDADSPVSGASSCSAASSRDQSMTSLEEYSHGHGGARWGEAQRVRSELLNMLQLMDKKYYQCLEEIQSTTAKFSGLMLPSGSGSGGGSICAPFAHRALLSAYRALRRRITGEIMAAAGTGAAALPSHHPHRAESSVVSIVKVEQSSSWDESAFIQKRLAVRRRPPHQEWRPQRGLPEKSVSVLKAWLFENFLHPYPQDSEKDMLAARSGLTRNQVANWFINARVRLWKPLIVELHEELKRSSGERDGPAQAMEQMSSQYVVG